MLPVTFKRLTLRTVAGVVCACAISCGGGSTQPQPPGTTPGPTAVATVTLNVSLLSLYVGQTLQLTATSRDQSGGTLTARAVSWSSGDVSVASVSLGGLVSALAAGSTNVTAAVEGKSASATITAVPQGVQTFDLSRELLGAPRTLSASVQNTNSATGQVTIVGGDTRRPNTPFIFDWGDGIVTVGFFSPSHTYSSASRNYVARVTATYSGSESDSVDVPIRFVAPQISRVPFPSELTVTIPNPAPPLGTRLYRPPDPLLPFDDFYFSAALPRQDVEYVLSQVAAVEFALVAGDLESINGEFRQVVLRDPNFGGAYSLWYTSPVALAAAGSFFQGTPGYSSLFHEMGHNLSLNAPAALRYGGNTDGAASAVFSEAVAQMFQHTAAFELVNNAARYGLPDDLAQEIAASARSSAQVVRASYEAYLSQGRPFATWNDPVTPTDETFGTFMALARQFLVHAEQAHSYVVPLSRAMRLLRTLNQDMLNQYAPRVDSVAASTFRATLMVAALSYGFQEDLRAEFRALNYLIDDATYTRLYSSVP